jgi:hypothetical protein
MVLVLLGLAGQDGRLLRLPVEPREQRPVVVEEEQPEAEAHVGERLLQLLLGEALVGEARRRARAAEQTAQDLAIQVGHVEERDVPRSLDVRVVLLGGGEDLLQGRAADELRRADPPRGPRAPPAVPRLPARRVRLLVHRDVRADVVDPVVGEVRVRVVDLGDDEHVGELAAERHRQLAVEARLLVGARGRQHRRVRHVPARGELAVTVLQGQPHDLERGVRDLLEIAGHDATRPRLVEQAEAHLHRPVVHDPVSDQLRDRRPRDERRDLRALLVHRARRGRGVDRQVDAHGREALPPDPKPVRDPAGREADPDHELREVGPVDLARDVRGRLLVSRLGALDVAGEELAVDPLPVELEHAGVVVLPGCLGQEIDPGDRVGKRA